MISAASSPADLASHAGAVVSPMVGTAYLAANPEAKPFISVGQKVAAPGEDQIGDGPSHRRGEQDPLGAATGDHDTAGTASRRR